MDSQSWSSVKLLVTKWTLEMFRPLMLLQNFFIVKFSVTVPTPGFARLSLFSAHLEDVMCFLTQID